MLTLGIFFSLVSKFSTLVGILESTRWAGTSYQCELGHTSVWMKAEEYGFEID